MGEFENRLWAADGFEDTHRRLAISSHDSLSLQPLRSDMPNGFEGSVKTPIVQRFLLQSLLWHWLQNLIRKRI
jgi:hypothetical protein